MSTEDNLSTEFSPKTESIDKDQRRLLLLNDANYGIVLCFLEKFRSVLDLPNYSLQRLEDHLINYEERNAVPARLIDYHFILLKRLSLAKNTQREKFDSIITKFASRFDLNDGDHLATAGYLQAEINVKIRILKNLLESQFDLNQTFRNTLVDKAAREIKSAPLGRDRFGVSYWLFVGTDCFVRLFREDADIDRAWSNVAKDRDELENFIKLLITDSAVREKFADWAIDYEPFSCLTPSNEFQKLYLPSVTEMKEEEEEYAEPMAIEDEKLDESTKKRRGRPKSSAKSIKSQIEIELKHEEATDLTSMDDETLEYSAQRKRGRPKGSITPVKKEIKQEDDEEKIEPTLNDDEKPNEPMKKKRGRPKGSIKSLNNEKNPVNVEIKEEKQEASSISDAHETSDVLIKTKPGRQKSIAKQQIDADIKSEDIEMAPNGDDNLNESMKKKRGRPRSSVRSIKKEKTEIETEVKSEPKEEAITPARRGRKRKIVTEENSNDEDNDTQNEESFVYKENLSTRRSARPRKSIATESTSAGNSKASSQVPAGKRKRSMNGKSKASNDPTTSTNSNKSGRSRRRRKATSRRNLNDDFCFSTSSSDEHIDYLSDDEYNSDDYLPNAAEIANDDNFFELDEDNNATGEQLRSAKTAQASTIVTACKICFKSDRPEVLLLCDDCDDAYHLECLRPKLLSVPDGDWYCPLCEHKKLSNHLIEKLKELLINFNIVEQNRTEYNMKKTLERKIKAKEYSSDESITASESEQENLDDNLHADESMLSISQTNENSNVSSSYIDDSTKNISQRGRHRRTRFDMNKMLHDDEESNDDSDSGGGDDDEYVENTTQITNFDLQIPKKMTRLLNPRYRPIARNDQQLKPKPIAPRFHPTATDINGKPTATIIYSNGHLNPHQMRPIIANSNQTLKIVRRWNDVQRRNKFRISNMQTMNETTSDCADENSVFCPDDASPPRSNESRTNSDMKDDDSTIIRSKITLVQPANLLPMYKSSTKNIVSKNEVNFDRLTRDIQYAVSEANTLSAIPKTMDQQNVKRIQKTNFSPYLTKVSVRPLPLLLPKPVGAGYKIFKSKDPPNSSLTTADLSNIILTPSSSSSLLDVE
ncbi:unnamed protein product [Rotaria socialis]|uniref:PHD-type domain-containing protein n=1 Tax=Rotaria socialis TaxID=392032 RepID=A0A817TQA1_9BILA|nr:unnamed protein product [Rotaria socialis]